MHKYLISAEHFIRHYGIARALPDEQLLSKILSAFKSIPYENISKIISADESAHHQEFRMPDTLIEEHILHGTGGTCFSLTFFLKQILDYCGFKSGLVLADRTYGSNTHCCILADIKGSLFLADIGYLIFKPVKMPESGGSFPFSYGSYSFMAQRTENLIDISSVFNKGYTKFRYRIKTTPVDNNTFFDAWKESFKFDMMNHMIVNAYTDDSHIYVKDIHIHGTKDGGKKDIESIISLLSGIGISRQISEKAAVILGLK